MCILLFLFDTLAAIVDNFTVKATSSRTVRVSWTQVKIDHLDHYSLYYYPDTQTLHRKKRQNQYTEVDFPPSSSSWLIGGLKPMEKYVFALAVVLNIKGEIFEGDRKELQYTLPGPGLLGNCMSAFWSQGTEHSLQKAENPTEECDVLSQYSSVLLVYICSMTISCNINRIFADP